MERTEYRLSSQMQTKNNGMMGLVKKHRTIACLQTRQTCGVLLSVFYTHVLYICFVLSGHVEPTRLDGSRQVTSPFFANLTFRCSELATAGPI